MEALYNSQLKPYGDFFLKKYIKDYNSLSKNELYLIAARNSIGAAVKRNSTYCKNITKESKNRIRTQWQEFLFEYLDEINNDNNLTSWKSVLSKFKKSMNDSFDNNLWFDEFRISHSQKSLSVFKKYDVCIKLHFNEEFISSPMCPIDRIVFKKSRFPFPIPSWGKMNNMEEYETATNIISQKLSVDIKDLWKWELINF
ncbi:MAG: hypothetical protein E6R13_02260 [Spirochaetes bacterium]|nr:MAG: hypothetical protein E6R13_02260 [Spirochaetota bacterium]